MHEMLDCPAIIEDMEELDVIELLSEMPSTSWREGNSRPWRAGTTGTVLELRPEWALVEICNDEGETLDIIKVPLDQANVVWSLKDHRAPEVSDDITVRAAVTRSPRR